MERSVQINVSLRERFLSPHVLGAAVLALSYCLFHYWMGGFMLCHLLFAGVVIVLYLTHPLSRQLVFLASPLLLKEVLFDFLRYIPFDWLKPIHVIEPYLVDTALFGLVRGGTLVPLHEFVGSFANGFWNLLFGAAYHLLEPVAYLSLFLLWRLHSRGKAERYAVALLLMNLFAFMTYVSYPAAAPWYVHQYGFLSPAAPVLGNPAGLAQFDAMLGVPLSAGIYGSSPFVFGAIPSMHAGITMMSLLFFLHLRKKWALGMGVYVLTMWVGALYLQHHYLIDVVLGMLYALVAYLIVEKGIGEQVNKGCQWFQKCLDPEES